MSEHASHLWQWRRTGEGRRFLAFFLAAALVRLLLAPYHGFVIDLQDYVDWGLLVDHHFLHFYSLSSGEPFYALPNYPPLAMYLYGLMTGVYFGLAHLLGIQASSQVAASPLLSVWIKLPVLVADLGVIGVLYRLARAAFSERGALVVVACYAFAPAILFDGAFWGQTDGLSLLPLLLALLFTLRRRGIWAGVMLGLAIMLKPQPVIFAPVALVWLWRWAGWREAARALGSLALTVLLICVPYLLPPRPEMLAFYQNTRAWAGAGHASDGAFNLWWLLASKQSASAPLLGPVSPDVLGWGLFLLVLLMVIAGIWRDRSAQRLFLAVALLALAFFVVTPLQHERYLYPALAPFLVAGFYYKRSRWFYGIASASAFLNMVIILVINSPDFAVQAGFWQDLVLRHLPAIILTTIALALLNIGLLLWVLVVYLLGIRGEPAAPVAVVAGASSAVPGESLVDSTALGT